MKICCVCGARPNFMKVAAVVHALERHSSPFDARIVHTGQHYDAKLSKAMFDDLALPRPDVNLEVGSGSHATQTAEVMLRFERVIQEMQPDLVLVVGDVNSTVAASLVASKEGIAVAHVEAGLRSRDRTMPEELNRLVTDSLSDLLFASEQSGLDNLLAEGVPESHVFFVGNVMIDTLLTHRERARRSSVVEDLGLAAGEYAVLTLHRPANVDEPERLREMVETLERVGRRIPLVFPSHPRTRARLESLGLAERLDRERVVRLIEPLGYLDFLRLTMDARLVLTDSGGIQEEATILRVPCLTLRDNTERPATVEAGMNRVIGAAPSRLEEAVAQTLSSPPVSGEPPARWDGAAGDRIAETLARLGTAGLEELRQSRSGGLRAAGVAPLPSPSQ